MKKIGMVLSCCIAFQASASVDWQAMKAELVDEEVLANARGKYLVAETGDAFYFGITMVTHWSDGSSSGSAGMDIEIENRNVTITRHDGGSDYITGELDNESHEQGSGMVQLIQVEGQGNNASNDSSLALGDSLPESDSLANQSNVEYYHTNDQIGYKVSIGDESFSIQEIRGLSNSKGVYQGINLVGNDLAVTNQLLMQVKLPSSLEKNRQFHLSHSLIKTLN